MDIHYVGNYLLKRLKVIIYIKKIPKIVTEQHARSAISLCKSLAHSKKIQFGVEYFNIQSSQTSSRRNAASNGWQTRCALLMHMHDDVIEWKHFLCYLPFVRGIHRSPLDSPHKGQWHGALTFSLICAWTNSWGNNRDDGDLRRHSTHYDITVNGIRVMGYHCFR